MKPPGPRGTPPASPSLFEAARAPGPLADRMRPRSFDEVVGQEHLTAPGAAFRRLVESGRLGSAILWGPPGTGKTTLAAIVARTLGSRFVSLSAVMSGVKEVREVMEAAARDRPFTGKPTLLFLDEIHRFNKAQQDAFLPRVESGDLVLLGATTENPSFEVNAALLSRSAVHVLRPLGPEAVATLIRRALADAERGLAEQRLLLEDDAVDALVAFADGDARRALNALEVLAGALEPAADGMRRADRATIARVLEKRLLHDKRGDSHYDTISAFIKSMRNSDPDAAVYWLARLLEAGEDPLFVARRIVILAAEDVGLADPQALPLAVATFQGVHAVGMPEARLLLSEAAIYLALAAKSNSTYAAYGRAAAAIRDRPSEAVPLHLRNAVTGLMRGQGYGAGYRYAHDDPAASGEMSCLPEGLAGERFFEPRAQGAEAELVERHAERRRTGSPGRRPAG